MHVLLPPSETKQLGGDHPFVASTLSGSHALAETRAVVRRALDELCAAPESAAAALKLGVKSRGELEHNRTLSTAVGMPAIDRYAGVLYDALGAAQLDDGARAWLHANVSVQSALFGLVGGGEEIPAYRLSAGTRLPQLGRPLKHVWRDAHRDIDWAELGWVLDLRSKDYVELAPLPAGAGASLEVLQRSESGETRALNHFNKAAKGDLVRRLAVSGADIRGPRDLLDWGRAHGLELSTDQAAGKIMLVTNLTSAAAAKSTHQAHPKHALG